MAARQRKIRFPSRSQRALAAILLRNGTEFRAKCKDRGIDRVSLWRYARGDRRPDVEPMFVLAEVESSLPVDGWRLDAAAKAA